jgi:DNA polymerase elongation subunit (family B)
MTEKQTQRHNNGATQNNFNAIRQHLEDLNQRLVELLGKKYALPKPREGNDTIAFATHCLYYTHNEKHEDESPSAWIKVFLSKGQIVSGCSKCGRAQVVSHNGEWQPAPTLKTLSYGNERLLQTLLELGCKEFPLRREEAKALENVLPEKEKRNRQPRVGFPVIYADGSQGFHFRVALEGKEKWRHMKDGKAGEAIFGLHSEIVKRKIQAQRFVIITESQHDASVLITADFPAISGAGCGNTPKALACELHRETLLSLLGDNGTIYVWQEPDAPDFAQKIANSLQRPVKVIKPPVPEEEEDAKVLKDARRLWENKCGKDWVGFKAVINELLQNATEVVAPQPEPKPKIISARQALEQAVWRPLREITPPPDEGWLVEDLIYQGNLVILSARPKTSKSIVALNLAACVAMGKPFLDRSVTQCKALYVAYERHKTTYKRAKAMGLWDCDYFMLWDRITKKSPRVDCLDGWVDFMERYDIKLAVFDTLAHFLRPELEKVRNAINAYDHVYKVMEMLQSAASDTGCTIVLIHHDRKGETAETDEARVLGTTALTASIDTILQLKPMGDGVICLKASGNEIEETTLFFKVGENFWIELTDKPTTTKEEKATQAIEGYLRQHGEATRKRLIDLMVEIGLAENKTTADKLVDRAIQNRLVTKVKKEYKGRELVYHWQGGRVISPAPLLDGDPQESPAKVPDPQGGLKTTKTDIEFVYGVNRQEATVDTVDIVDIVDNDRLVYGVYNSQPDPQRLTPKTNPIYVANVYNSRPETQPEADQPCAEAQSEGSLPDLPANKPDLKPKAKDLLDSYIAEVITEAKCPACETELAPESNGKAACLGCGRVYFVVAPQQTPAIIERVEDGCVVVATEDWLEDDSVVVASDEIPPKPEVSPDGDQTTEPEQDNETEESPPEQPIETLNEPICPYCGEILEPDPESGLATCAGCGRLFEVDDYPPDNPDDGDDNPPESPDDGDNPPNPPNNGHGRSQTGFAPPEAPSSQPNNQIYLNKFNLPAILNRMTERLPDGSIKIAWQNEEKKTETVAPNELDCWQPIEDIPEFERPKVESIEIPPVVVLDLETDGLDPKYGRILAAGLALFVEGEAKEMSIVYNNEVNDDGEANLLLQVFDWLRETYDRFGEFILTGYNMFDFDLPFIIVRSRRLGLNSECPFGFQKDKNGNIKRLSIPDTDGKFTYTGIITRLPIMLIDTQHLVIRNDMFEKVLLDYSLKSVAEHFSVNIPDRPKLSHEEIKRSFFNDRAKFNAYLFADLRETYALFDLLIKPFASIAAITRLDLEDIARKHGRGWIWQKHYERHYSQIPQADPKRDYVGGLVVSRKGLWFNCAKFDIASLYPTTILAYQIHSRKDPEQIGLRYLKTYLIDRLELKRIAKETGDKMAQMKQEGEKVLINSHYGYFASPFPFNDYDAAERVTKIGRKVLTCMIAAVEDMGLFVVEADTDGLIVCCQDRDPHEVWKAISAAIPPVFKVEMEWQGKTVFVSDDKNYIVFDANGNRETIKGGKWRGRDKSAYQTEAIPEFVKRWFTQGVEAALEYAREVLEEIRSGNGWRWVVCTRRVSENDKSLQRRGFKVGEKATFAYKRKTSKAETTEIALTPEEGYDCKYYAGEFYNLVKEVIAAIDPAQTEAWREIVAQEARPLIFATT